MADVLKQTLFYTVNPVLTFVSDATGLSADFASMTAAESHDGSDLTYSAVSEGDDNIGSINANFVWRCDSSTVTISTVVGTISFVRVKYRGKRQNVTNIACSLQPTINGVSSGAVTAMTTAFVSTQQDFLVDPGDGLAWTNARINGRTWGVMLRGSSSAGLFNRQPECYCSEFSLEVWGPAVVPLVLSPTTIELSAKVYERFDTPQTEAVVYSGSQNFGSFAIIDPEYYETGSNQRGIVSHGFPYFMVAAISGITGGPQYEGPLRPAVATQGIEVMFKLHRPPQQFSSSREIHALVAFCSQITKRTSFGIGVTPDLGVAFISNQDPPFMITPPGTIRVGERVVVRATSKSTFRNLQVNDQQFNDTRSGVQIGVAPGEATFPSLFGDLTGLSRITGEISGVNYYNSFTKNWCYPLLEGVGVYANALINDNVDLPTGTPASQHGIIQAGPDLDEFYPARLKLTALWEIETGFTPTLGFVWGPPNTAIPIQSAFHWGARQGYDLAGNPIQSPFFHPRFGSGGTYSPRGPATPAYERR
jgi:hypothetical protein